MDNQFEPLHSGEIIEQFYPWEDASLENKEPIVDRETAFAMECEAIREANKTQGFEQGLLEANAEIEALKATLSDLITLIEKPVKLLDKALTAELVQVLFWIATSCIRVELSQSPEKIEAILNALKAELPSIQGDKQVSLHPKDIEYIEQHCAALNMDELKNILIADDNLSPGDFYIKSDAAIVDGRLTSRIRAIIATHIEVGSKDE